MSSENSVISEFLEAWETVTAYYQGQHDEKPDSGAIYLCIMFVEYLHDLVYAPDIDDDTRRHAVHLKATIRTVLLEVLRRDEVDSESPA
ncbi:hypothetical protein HC928_20140 [bacterium]|nr:hypothetical protein [bacterium]